MAEEFKNPFKELDKKLLDVPPEMRQKVMNDIAIAKLIMDMAILVTSNFSSIISGMFKTNTKRN